MIGTTAKGWIGIDVGSRAIKVAQVARHGRSLSLEAAAVVERTGAETLEPLQPGSRIVAADDIQAAVSTEIAFSGKQAACTLSMACCEYRSEPLPPNAGRDLQRVAEQIARSTASAACEFDYWSTQIGDEPTLHVVALPTSQANQVAQDHRHAGLVCHTVDALPTALARAVAMTGESAGGPVAVLDWGYSQATLVVVIDDTPMYVRRLRDSSFAPLAAAVGHVFAASPAEVRQLLTENGFPGGNTLTELQEALLEGADDPLQQLIDELKKTISYLRSHMRTLAPRALVLTGGGSTIANVDVAVQERIQLPSRKWKYRSLATPSGSVDEGTISLLAQAIAASTLKWSTP